MAQNQLTVPLFAATNAAGGNFNTCSCGFRRLVRGIAGQCRTVSGALVQRANHDGFTYAWLGNASLAYCPATANDTFSSVASSKGKSRP
ncbi:hypothetical protein KCP69_14005 [Salmonella enterica subsp. enterica]|nr:hypothetical protein KCP69_14005 [Salmonella enterica subsp. enterica]